MSELVIRFMDDSELAEFEAINKGFRLDVYIKIETSYFNVRVYDIVRLQQDFTSEIESYGYYVTEPNLVLVKEVSNEVIISTLNKLYKQEFFNHIKPLSGEEANQINSKIIF